MNDYIAIVIAFVYVFAVLGIAEALRRGLALSTDFTRKVVHIAVGMWSWCAVLLFESRWMAIVPPAAFVALNYISYRRDIFKAMEAGDRSNLGTVYFPAAFVAIILASGEQWKTLLPLALMPMTWGDSFASIVGRRFGRRKYAVGASTRSIEGSAAMFAFSLISVAAALWSTTGQGITAALSTAFLVALAATVAEALSVRGLDNLFVPAASLAVLLAL